MSEAEQAPDQTSPIAEVREAVKRFATPEGGAVTALDGVSLKIQLREFVTLLGPSGCGKTTLLRAISGLEELDGGEVWIAGQPMTDVPPQPFPRAPTRPTWNVRRQPASRGLRQG